MRLCPFGKDTNCTKANWHASTIRDNGRYWPPASAHDPEFFRAADGLLDALWLPDCGFVDDPQLAAVNMMDAAIAAGTTLRLRTEVTSVMGRPIISLQSCIATTPYPW